MSEIAAPFISRELHVRPEWIDYNGHLNLAYYHVLFDMCCDEAVLLTGCGPSYRKKTNHTIFAAETHVCYLRELNLNDVVRGSFQLIAFDQRRMHIYLELRHIDGWIAATAEILWLHIDQSGPRVTSFPMEVQDKVQRLHDAHQDLGKPKRIGRRISLG